MALRHEATEELRQAVNFCLKHGWRIATVFTICHTLKIVRPSIVIPDRCVSRMNNAIEFLYTFIISVVTIIINSVDIVKQYTWEKLRCYIYPDSFLFLLNA